MFDWKVNLNMLIKLAEVVQSIQTEGQSLRINPAEATDCLIDNYIPSPRARPQSLATHTRLWYQLDARRQVVGRLAVKLSSLLQGKTKPIYHPAGEAWSED